MYFRGREGRIGGLSGLRGHETAAGEGGVAIELAPVHLCSQTLNGKDRHRELVSIEGLPANFTHFIQLFWSQKKREGGSKKSISSSYTLRIYSGTTRSQYYFLLVGV